MRMVEHAGVAMAERYKRAIDDICGPDALAILDVPEWNQLTFLDQVLPSDESLPSRRSYNVLLDKIRGVILKVVLKCVDNTSNRLPNFIMREKFFSHAAKSRWDMSELGMSYLVPKRDLVSSQSFSDVYAGLNKYQRALCPFVWLEMRDLFIRDLVGTQEAYNAAMAFFHAFQEDKERGLIPSDSYPDVFDKDDLGFYKRLFDHALSNLSAYGASFSERPDREFGYSITQHLVLNLSEAEMDYLRYENETVYEADIPEAKFGPGGPGPAYHTEDSVPSVSDSVVGGMDDMTIRSSCSGGASTVVGSVVVQDGISTVFDRRRVLAPSSRELASERFTDDAMSADFAEAEFAVPTAHQPLARALEDYVAGSQEGDDDDRAADRGLDLGLDDDDDDDDDEFGCEAFGDSGDDCGDEDEDDGEGDIEIISHADVPEAAGQRPRDG